VVLDGNNKSSVTVSGVRGNLFVRLEEGSDILKLDNVYLAGSLTIDDKSRGDDIVVFGETGVVSARGNCSVYGSSSGQDLFVAHPYKAFFGGSLSITHGTGTGAVSMVGASAADIYLLGMTEVSMQGVTSGGKIYIRSFPSGDLAVPGRVDASTIGIFTSAATAGIHVEIPDGRNSVYIDTSYSGAGIVVDAYTRSFPGTGEIHVPGPAPFNINDTITIARCQARTLSVDTSGPAPDGRLYYTGGDDTVFLYGNYLVGPAASSISPVLNVKAGDGVDSWS
jgi:hypothetical protein